MAQSPEGRARLGPPTRVQWNTGGWINSACALSFGITALCTGRHITCLSIICQNLDNSLASALHPNLAVEA